METEWSDLKEEKISQKEIEYFDSQEKNILDKSKTSLFEGVKFGDKFLCRDGGIAIFLEENDEGFIMMYEEICIATVSSLGCIDNCDESDYDIVSRYKEEIDEEELSKYAFEECPYEVTVNPKAETFFEGFYSGYKKAKER